MLKIFRLVIEFRCLTCARMQSIRIWWISVKSSQLVVFMWATSWKHLTLWHKYTIHSSALYVCVWSGAKGRTLCNVSSSCLHIFSILWVIWHDSNTIHSRFRAQLVAAAATVTMVKIEWRQAQYSLWIWIRWWDASHSCKQCISLVRLQ